MTELSEEQRTHLKDDQFAYVDKHGERHLPIDDDEHIRNAIQRFGRTDFDSPKAKEQAARTIVKAAKAHGVEVSADDDVARAAH